MTTESTDKNREIDPDKLVHRLLDMIQKQQDELGIARQQLDYVLHAAQLPQASALTPSKPIRVDSIAEEGREAPALPAPQPEIQGPKTFGQVMRDNLIFISICLILALATLVIALKPPPSEIRRLNRQLEDAGSANKEATVNHEKELKAKDDQIIALQKALTDTQSALTQNERALTDALGQSTEVSDTAANPAAPAPAAPRSSPVDTLAEARNTVVSLLSSIEQARKAITNNRDEFLQNARALATARLELYRDQLAVKVLKGEIDPSDVPRLDKKLEGFLPPKAQEISMEPENPVQVGPKQEADLPSSLSDLRDLGSKYSHSFSTLQSKLKFYETAIIHAQQDLLATQSDLKEEQELMITVRDNPPKQPPAKH